jgi:hypothetical protein
MKSSKLKIRSPKERKHLKKKLFLELGIKKETEFMLEIHLD